jgi:hypothetical protein
MKLISKFFVLFSLFIVTLLFPSGSLSAFTVEKQIENNKIVTEESTSDTREWNWTFGEKYFIGEIINYNGVEKMVRQDFTANGDSNWFNAPSLFSNSIGEFDLDTSLVQKGESIETSFIDDNGVEWTGSATLVEENISTYQTISNGKSTWKIYWTNPLGVSLRYYIDVYVNSSSIATIQSAYGATYSCTGCNVTSDTLSISRKTQSSSGPAEASYLVKYNTTVAGSTLRSGSMKMYSKVSGTNLKTGFY